VSSHRFLLGFHFAWVAIPTVFEILFLRVSLILLDFRFRPPGGWLSLAGILALKGLVTRVTRALFFRRAAGTLVAHWPMESLDDLLYSMVNSFLRCFGNRF